VRLPEAIDYVLLRNSPSYAGRRAMRAPLQIPVVAYLLDAGGKDLFERTNLSPDSMRVTEAYKRGMRTALDRVVNANMTLRYQRDENVREHVSYPNADIPPRRNKVTLKELDQDALNNNLHPALTPEDNLLDSNLVTQGTLRIVRKRFQEGAGQAYVAWLDHDPGVVIPDYPAYPQEFRQPPPPPPYQA